MNKVNHFCGNCVYFLHEDALGNGFCQVLDREARCGDRCSLRYDTLTDRQIIRLLPDLSVRLQRALQCSNIKNLMTFVRMNKASLLRIRNLGKKCATELMDALEGLGLKLDMSSKEIYNYVNGR